MKTTILSYAPLDNNRLSVLINSDNVTSFHQHLVKKNIQCVPPVAAIFGQRRMILEDGKLRPAWDVLDFEIIVWHGFDTFNPVVNDWVEGK
jgi:hypothetical protein